MAPNGQTYTDLDSAAADGWSPDQLVTVEGTPETVAHIAASVKAGHGKARRRTRNRQARASRRANRR